jgi:hypothetical protein
MMRELTNGTYAISWRDAAVRRAGWQPAVRRTLRNVALTCRSRIDFRSEATFLRCLACHYVFDDQREDFQQIIRMLKNQGQFIDTKTCLDMAEGRSKIDGKYFHLSFDDGLKNVIQNALPILSEEQVPMILFVPTQWIGADWNAAYQFTVEIARYRQPIEMATWDDLREMIQDGFDIGSHTQSHVRLSTITNDLTRLQQELVGSKQKIEEELGIECSTIAYPFGMPNDYDDQTLKHTIAAGYRAAFAIHRGSISEGQSAMHCLPRHHFEAEWPPSHIRYFANGNMEVRR